MGPRIQCLNCNDVIQSEHRNHMTTCECGIRAKAAIRECFSKLAKYVDPENTHAVLCVLSDCFDRGISADGGDDYLKMSLSKQSRYKELEVIVTDSPEESK